MRSRFLPLILPLLALPALAACSSGKDDAPPPLDKAALDAVVAKPGVSRQRLAREIDNLFADDKAGETRALLVMSNGRVVAERYGEGYDRNTLLIGWSASKTITGVLIGLLIADGRLRLDEGAPVAAWQRPGDPRGAITLRQLLQMRSGLRHSENAKPPYNSGEVRMLFLDGRDDMAAWAEAQPLEAEPGKKWKYSTATTVILCDIAVRALTDNPDPEVRRHTIAEYLRTRLFEPAGMKTMVPEFDAAGTLIGSSMIHGTARDWAAFGEFLREGGTVKGAQLLPSGWMDFMTGPSPTNPAYGAQVWLNRRENSEKPAMLPDAPASLFAARGHLGQYVIVSPAQGLTVVRLGKSSEPENKRVRAHLNQIVRLFPKR
jgi:CubicO group peptidase (beta-lactamase class C family)